MPKPARPAPGTGARRGLNRGEFCATALQARRAESRRHGGREVEEPESASWAFAGELRGMR